MTKNNLKITVNLTITGIGTSECFSMHMGGVNGCLEYIITGIHFFCFLGYSFEVSVGEAFSQLETAVAESGDGEVVVSEQTWALIHPFVKGVKLQKNWKIQCIDAAIPKDPLPSTPSIDTLARIEPLIVAYIQVTMIHHSIFITGFQPAVVERIKAGQLLYLGEFRMVTVLFIGLATMTQPALLQEAVIVIQQTLFQYEGFVRKTPSWI